MNRSRPYVNRFVKRKQQEIQDSYHCSNLKEMKPMNSKFMEHQTTIVINNSKREMIKQVREIEIQRQNRLLLQKIATVMGKRGAYSVAKTKHVNVKPNKSLNDIFRKRQLQSIELQNRRFLQRLHNKRATLNTEKMNKDWTQNKNTIKRMANADFYLTNIRSASRMRSITSQRFYKSNKYDRMKLMKQKVIDGQRMMVKVEFVGNVLKIIGDSQDSKDIKIIEIPKDQAIAFLQKNCQAKFQLLLEKLKYDAPTGTLYLLSQSLQEEQNLDLNDNPQIDINLLNNVQIKKKTVEEGRKNKSALQKIKNPRLEVNFQHSASQLQKKRTISAQSEVKFEEKKSDERQIDNWISNQLEAVNIEHGKDYSENSIGKIGKSNEESANIEGKQSNMIQKYQEVQLFKVEEQEQVKKEPKTQKEARQVKNQQKYEKIVDHKSESEKFENYEEQAFEQSHNKPQGNSSELIQKPEIQESQPREIIVEPESVEDYVQQFQESAQTKKLDVAKEIQNK